MKKILLALSLFICSVSFGQNIHTRLDYPIPQAYGNVYYKTSWAATTDFTLTGDATVTLSGTNISMSCTTTGTLAQFATIGALTDLNKWTIINTFTAQTPGAATFGNAIGTHSYITTNFDCIGHLAQDNGATKGKMVIERGDGTVLASNANGSFAFSAADVITQILDYNDTVATYTCQNITTGTQAVSISFSYSIASTTQFTPSTSFFTIYEVGGTQVNSQISITSNSTKNANVLIAGTSKEKGYHASTWNRRLSYLLDPVYSSVTIHAGGSEALFNLNQEIAEVIAMNPKYCLLLSGPNDMRTPYSRTVAATAASFDSAYNTITAAGITCLVGQAPEDSTVSGVNASVGLTAFKNYLSAKYGALGVYIDLWTPMTTAGDNKLKSSMSFGDGIHPNDLGMQTMATAIINSGLIATRGTIVGSGSDSTVQYNNHGGVASISPFIWNQTMLRLESTKWLLNFSVGHTLDGMFMGSAGVDGGSLSGGGYYDGTNWKAAGSTAFSSLTLGSGAIVFYLNPTVTPYSTITPSAQFTFQTTGFTFVPGGTFGGVVSVTSVNAAAREFLVGTFGVQTASSLNNELLLENADNVSGTLKYTATGFMEAIYFQLGHLLFLTAPSGTAGTTVSAVTVPLDLFNNSVTISQPTTINSTLTVAGVTAPEANGTRDLGTSALAWRSTITTGANSHGHVNVSGTGTYSALGTDYTIEFTGSTATLAYPTVNLVNGRQLQLINYASGSITIPSTKSGNAATITTLTTNQKAIVEYDLANTTWILVSLN